MHAAPAVRVELGRSRGWVAFVALLSGAAAGQLAAWTRADQSALTSVLAVALGLLAAAAGARAAWRAQLPGVLAWDGAQWQWAGRAGEVAVMLDLQGWLLLRFRSGDTGRRTWIAASRRASSGPWGALRVALYSPRPADPLDVPPA